PRPARRVPPLAPTPAGLRSCGLDAHGGPGAHRAPLSAGGADADPGAGAGPAPSPPAAAGAGPAGAVAGGADHLSGESRPRRRLGEGPLRTGCRGHRLRHRTGGPGGAIGGPGSAFPRRLPAGPAGLHPPLAQPPRRGGSGRPAGHRHGRRPGRRSRHPRGGCPVRRFVLILAVALLAGGALHQLLDSRQGFVLLSVGHYVIETSLWTALVLVLLVIALLWLARRLWRMLVLPGRWVSGRGER